jgi:hypothetical protein
MLDFEPISVKAVSELHAANEQIRGELHGIRFFIVTMICIGIAFSIAYYKLHRDEKNNV